MNDEQKDIALSPVQNMMIPYFKPREKGSSHLPVCGKYVLLHVEITNIDS